MVCNYREIRKIIPEFGSVPLSTAAVHALLDYLLFIILFEGEFGILTCISVILAHQYESAEGYIFHLVVNMDIDVTFESFTSKFFMWLERRCQADCPVCRDILF